MLMICTHAHVPNLFPKHMLLAFHVAFLHSAAAALSPIVAARKDL